MKRFKLVKRFLVKHIYIIALTGILLLGATLRFYRFSYRWKIHNDPARDALVASQALKTHTLPLIGSFSSAGPFVFGPLFYYFLMLGYFIYPYAVISPWVLLTVLDVFLILVMVKIGNIIVSKRMGLVMGLLTAVSPVQLTRGNSLSQHTFLNFFSALTILSFCFYLKKKKLIYLFLTGLSLGSALNMHYQAILLLLFIPAIVFAESSNLAAVIKKIFFIFLGILIPSIPLLYWDSTQQWKNIKNILDYFLIGQYRIWVSRRWLTYLGKFWPDFWSEVINQELVFGYLFITLAFLIIVFLFIRKRLEKSILLLALIFFFQLTITRYYRGELFKGYLYFYHPFIFLFSALVIEKVWEWKKTIGITFFVLSIALAIKNDLLIITKDSNEISTLTSIIGSLTNKYPNKKFRIYNYGYSFDSTLAFELSLFLSFRNLIDERHGLLLGTATVDFDYPKIIKETIHRQEFYVYSLQEVWSNPNLLNQEEWINSSPQYVCNDILEWWKAKEFKSYFNLRMYLQEKIKQFF